IFKKQGEAAPEGVAVIGELENKRTRESKVEDQVFYIVEEMPTFQGGEAGNFRSFIMKNVVYPQEAKAKKEEGQVFVEFIVDATGSVTNVKVVRGVSPALDKEAIRVVQSSPAWGPGKQHGKNVPVKFTFPIMFSLQ
ncbi:MAG: energy transducer TonB, partial [Bacteroidota bacterium]